MRTKSILVVDDSEVHRHHMSQILDEAGYMVILASDGQEALDYLRAHPSPDLILLDLMMPVLSGWEFRERQQQDPALADIPVVILSASGQEAAEKDVLGDVGYLQVPVEEGELLAAIDRFTVLQKPEILVVEDDTGVRNMLDMVLRQSNFSVRIAGAGIEAITLYQRHHESINLVLLDVQLPGLDGPQILTVLQKLNPRVRCCFMSGHTGKYSAEELRAMGAIHVLSKPFMSMAQLTQQLWELANRRE